MGAPPPVGRMPITYAEAEAQGVVDRFDWGDRCDRERGTVKIVSVRAAPCVPVFDGDNGGATHRGVSREAIRVVVYMGGAQGDLNTALAGLGLQDPPEAVVETIRRYFEVFSSVYETYGRRFEVVSFVGSGAADDSVASRADAVEIAEDVGAFAVIGGPALDRGAFASELAAREVLCIGCGVALPDTFIRRHEPYIWGPNPTPEQFLFTLSRWMDRLMERDRRAAYAGSQELRQSERRFGVVHFEQDPPVFSETASDVLEMFSRKVDVVIPYLLDLPTLPEKATEIVARLKAEGVTSVIFMGDPLMPAQLMAAATRMEYFPEWIFTGTALTDTNVFGRGWDPRQMRHAFGLSNLAVPLASEEQSEAWRLYEWFFGEGSAPPARNQYPIHLNGPALISLGVHMAGPDLTPQTFARGLFRVPPSGGGPTVPQVSFGRWGFFEETDYLGIDDSTEIWWDPEAVGEDEIGRMGKGMWRRSRGGARFTSRDVPEPRVFEREGSVTVLAEAPPSDRAMRYPIPGRS